MANPLTIELANPQPDGVSALFATSRDYVPGTIFLLRGGLLLTREGVTEIDRRTISVSPIPRNGEDLRLMYRPR